MKWYLWIILNSKNLNYFSNLKYLRSRSTSNIRNQSLQPFSWDYNPVSYITYVLCVFILCMYSYGSSSLNSSPNDRFLRNISWQFFYLLSEFLPESCREPEKYIFIVCFIGNIWTVVWTVTSSFIALLAAHYLPDYYRSFPRYLIKLALYFLCHPHTHRLSA